MLNFNKNKAVFHHTIYFLNEHDNNKVSRDIKKFSALFLNKIL